MAIFHLDVQTISRAAGRSAVAASAYRSASRLYDERTGQIFDYARRRGIRKLFLALPATAPSWADDRAALWNAAEAAENRRNSVVSREWMVALPDELTEKARERLARELAAELVRRFDVAVDVAIHAPGSEGDQRNHHAHLMTSTRSLGAEGFGAKTRVLDAAKSGGVEIQAMRAWWADACNAALEAEGRSERIDPRAKGIQAAEAAQRALEADQEAEALEIIGGTAHNLSDLRRGLRAAVAHPAALFARNGTQKALKRRSEAQSHRERADRLSQPPARHQGPIRTGIQRRQEREAVAAQELWEAQRQETLEREWMAERRRLAEVKKTQEAEQPERSRGFHFGKRPKAEVRPEPEPTPSPSKEQPKNQKTSKYSGPSM